ncbi:MAG: YceI family protein [Alphaproteobacteria bacterium]
MKKSQLLLTIVTLLLTFNQNSLAQAVKYEIEPNHTSVLWIADHLGFSKSSGKFNKIEGNILFDEKKPENSSTEITIKTNGIVTGIEKFDDHLKGKDFFDVKNFAVAKFVSKKITISGKNKGKILGDITILGITKPITLDVTFNKSATNPINNKPTIGFSATASLNRSNFGIKYALPNVPDKVNLIIEVEANRQAD